MNQFLILCQSDDLDISASNIVRPIFLKLYSSAKFGLDKLKIALLPSTQSNSASTGNYAT